MGAVTVFWFLLALLVLAAGLAVRVRLLRRRARRRAGLDDSDIRRIERTGALRTDEEEPLDQDLIDEEERRFWEQSWDEPEPL